MKILSMFFMIFVLFVFCSDNNNVDEESLKNVDEESLKKDILGMINRHNAIIDWDRNLNHPIYTIDIQRLSEKIKGVPIFFRGFLVDILENNNEYITIWNSNLFSNDLDYELYWEGGIYGIHFKLKSNSNIINRLMQIREKDDFFSLFAIIAKIDNIQNLGLIINEISENEENYLVANGECLDFVYGGDDLFLMNNETIKEEAERKRKIGD